MAEQQANELGPSVGDTTPLREAAKLMGQVSTQAKAAAARENGKRGGRPKGIPMSAEACRRISEAKRARATRDAASSTSEIPLNFPPIQPQKITKESSSKNDA